MRSDAAILSLVRTADKATSRDCEIFSWRVQPGAFEEETLITLYRMRQSVSQ